MEEWKSYPIRVGTDMLSIDETVYHREILLQQSSSLFCDDGKRVELNYVNGIAGAAPSETESLVPRKATVTTASELKELLQKLPSDASDKYLVSFISQARSWSPLKITLDMFCLLGHHFQVFPAFINITSGFGSRTSAIKERMPTCYRQFDSVERSAKPMACEISYNLYHVEKHGRSNLKDPWSVRQTAVYHRLCLEKWTSTWVFIQLPEHIRSLLEESTMNGNRQSDVESTHAKNTFAVHVLVFKASQRNWAGYNRYLAECIAEFHDIASFSKVGHRPGYDYSLEFASCQKLELTQAKVRRALVIMQAQEHIALTIQRHYRRVTASIARGFGIWDYIELELQQCIEMIENHTREVKELMRSAESTRRLLFKILDHRNDNLIRENGISLKELAVKASSESNLMLCIAEHTRQDSRTMKIASLIALIYLPANLAASIFSSNLVQLASKDMASGSAQLQKETALFVCITLVLTGCTAATAFYWNRKRRSLVPLSNARLTSP